MKSFAHGDRVCMAESVKALLRKNKCAAHIREFGKRVGIVIGPTDYNNVPEGHPMYDRKKIVPEVDVRWEPSNLRYSYHPNHLKKSAASKGEGEGEDEQAKMKHPNPLMLVRIAQGDAYGLATEYIKFPRDQAVYDKALRFESYGQHPTHSLKPGSYSDDTQMSIAVTEVLFEEEGDFVFAQRFAEAFVRCFKRDQRDGYARGFQAFLETVKDGPDFIARIDPKSDKNGAAMRSVPLGVFADPYRVRDLANIQAKLTHDTLQGVESSILVALMSHFALHTDEPLSRIREWLKEHYPAIVPRFIAPWEGGPVKVPEVGINTARAVMTLLSTETSLIGIAKRTIEWGGDTDSVLAIAWGIASARYQDEELPPFFDGGLENGTYGYKFLKELGTKLMERYA